MERRGALDIRLDTLDPREKWDAPGPNRRNEAAYAVLLAAPTDKDLRKKLDEKTQKALEDSNILPSDYFQYVPDAKNLLRAVCVKLAEDNEDIFQHLIPMLREAKGRNHVRPFFQRQVLKVQHNRRMIYNSRPGAWRTEDPKNAVRETTVKASRQMGHRQLSVSQTKTQSSYSSSVEQDGEEPKILCDGEEDALESGPKPQSVPGPKSFSTKPSSKRRLNFTLVPSSKRSRPLPKASTQSHRQATDSADRVEDAWSLIFGDEDQDGGQDHD